VQASIKRKDLNTIKILVPCYEVQSMFSASCDGFLKSQHQKSLSIRQLTKLRDTLLPKLISGELRLPSDALPNSEQQLFEGIT
jgi:type I restriction enzyme S subunit